MPRKTVPRRTQLVNRPHSSEEHYLLLRLYIAGPCQSSSRALANIKAYCEEHLHGRYELEVIDIYQQPEHLQDDQIMAVPTLVRVIPLPTRTLVGDLSDPQRLAAWFNGKK